MKSTIIYTLLSIVFIVNIHAQSVNDSIINAKADSIIYDYSRYGGFTENDRSISKLYIRYFKELFANDAKLNNDIVTDFSSEKNLYVDDYINFVTEKYPSGITLMVDNLIFGKPTINSSNNTGIVKVTGNKEVLGMSISNEFDEESFELTFVISFNLDYSNFKIFAVEQKKIESLDFVIGVRNQKSGDIIEGVRINLFVNGNELHQSRLTNGQGEVYFDKIAPGSLVSLDVDSESDYTYPIKDNDKKVDAVEDLIGRVNNSGFFVELRKNVEWNKISLQVFGTPSLTQINSVNVTDNYKLGSFVNDAKFGYGLGIGVSYALIANKKIAVSIATGVGIDTYNGSITFDNYNQNKVSTFDSENDAYDLHVLSSKLTDNISITYISVPIMVNFRKYFVNGLFDYIFVNAGVNYGHLIDNSSDVAGEVTYYGFYKEIDGQIVNVNVHNVEKQLGFIDDKPLSSKAEMEISSMNLSAIASVGVSIPIIENMINLDIAANINYGFSNITNYDYKNYYFAKEGYFGSKSSLLGSGSSVNTMAVGVRVGVTYNIFK